LLDLVQLGIKEATFMVKIRKEKIDSLLVRMNFFPLNPLPPPQEEVEMGMMSSQRRIRNPNWQAERIAIINDYVHYG